MDKYDIYEEYQEYVWVDESREARRQRQGKDPRPGAKQYRRAKAKKMRKMSDNAAMFVPTYVAGMDPEDHERQWVTRSLGGFYANSHIADVLRLVKGGKEANVYCCQGHPKAGVDLIAAKLYRPRELRTLKNNALYKEGRMLRDQDGKLLLGSREARAMAKKTRFGKDLDLTNWIGHEFEIQTRLYEAGADVPRPVACAGNTILMEYMGDEWMPAPMLQEVTLAADEARALCRRLLHNVELMLTHHLVHGDLSAYNVLYWQGRIAIIDFPQAVDARKNPNAFALLERDVQRVYDYFATYEVEADATKWAADLWHRYMNAEL